MGVTQANFLSRGEAFIVYAVGGGSVRGSACSGDSGGPYVCNIGGVWKQFGVAG